MVRYELYSTGSNSHGQLGLDSEEDFAQFTRISLPSNTHPLKLAFGANHTLLLATVNGKRTLFGAGNNSAGQLGTGRKESRLRFEELIWADFVPQGGDISEEDYEIASIVSTWETSIVHLRPREGKEWREDFARTEVLVSFGSNDWGERGSETTREGGGSSERPSVISFAHLVQGPIKISQLVTGPRHVLATLHSLETDEADQLLVGWGAARHGQLGSLDGSSKLPKIVPRPQLVRLPTPFRAQEVIDIDCGKDHAALSLLHGHEPTVVVLGSNKHGQLGLPASNLTKTTERTATNSNVLRSNTLIRSSTSTSQIVRTTWNSTFIGTSPSDSTSSSYEPSLMSFGSNSHGQLGSQVPLNTDRSLSEDPSPTSGLRVVQFPSSPDSPTLPQKSTEISTFRSHLRLSTGSEHALVVIESLSPSTLPSNPFSKKQKLFAWGWNEHGNLGLGTGDLADRAEPVQVGGIIQEKLDRGGRIKNVWGGMATSWVSVRFEND
ncbi:hypothetical protein JCM3765_001159 [Sporobolomyces pararoseus]